MLARSRTTGACLTHSQVAKGGENRRALHAYPSRQRVGSAAKFLCREVPCSPGVTPCRERNSSNEVSLGDCSDGRGVVNGRRTYPKLCWGLRLFSEVAFAERPRSLLRGPSHHSEFWQMNRRRNVPRKSPDQYTLSPSSGRSKVRS